MSHGTLNSWRYELKREYHFGPRLTILETAHPFEILANKENTKYYRIESHEESELPAIAQIRSQVEEHVKKNLRPLRPNERYNIQPTDAPNVVRVSIEEVK